MRYLLLALALCSCRPKPGSGPVGPVDADGDGFLASVDCDDTNPDIAPFVPEICDGVDQNCDGVADEGAGDTPFHPDLDGDGFGDPGVPPLLLCGPEDGFVPNDLDCDDADRDVHPDAAETCNGADDDCDGVTDPPTTEDAATFYADADSDGFGDAGNPTEACEAPDGFVTDATDCDDADEADHPGATEVCDLDDDDCDGDVDEGTTRFYADADGDGFGGGAYACTAAAGSVTNDADCDDTSRYVFPGGTELCDGLQNDCDAAAWTSADEDGLVTAESTTGTWTPVTFGGAGAVKTYPIPASGTVWFCDGTWALEMTADVVNTTLAGRNGSTTTTISGGGAGRILTVTGKASSLTLTGLTLTLGAANGQGGAAIRFEKDDGALVLDDVVLDDNDADGPGGAIRLSKGTITGTDCRFANNDSTGNDGGAIYADESTLSFTDCDFDTNTADGDGGAIYAVASTSLTISGGTLHGNVGDLGGALHVNGSALAVSDATFEQNIGETNGGGMYLTGAGMSATLTDTDFEANEARGSVSGAGGGGIDMRGGTLSITGGEFADNLSNPNDGAALQCQGGTTTVTEASFHDNVSADEGGAISMGNNSATLALVGTVITGNTAKTGGAIDMDLGTITCADAASGAEGKIVGNTASSAAGGGALNLAVGSFTSTGCDFGTSAGGDDNSPDDIYAGGEYNYDDGASFVCTGSGCVP